MNELERGSGKWITALDFSALVALADVWSEYFSISIGLIGNISVCVYSVVVNVEDSVVINFHSMTLHLQWSSDYLIVVDLDFSGHVGSPSSLPSQDEI